MELCLEVAPKQTLLDWIAWSEVKKWIKVAGAYDVLQKPYTAEKLLATLRRLLDHNGEPEPENAVPVPAAPDE